MAGATLPRAMASGPGRCPLGPALLVQFPILETLSLSGCMIEDRGLRSWASGLGSARRLRVLYLRQNSLSSDAGKLIVWDILRSTTLEELYLGTNGLGDEGASKE